MSERQSWGHECSLLANCVLCYSSLSLRSIYPVSLCVALDALFILFSDCSSLWIVLCFLRCGLPCGNCLSVFHFLDLLCFWTFRSKCLNLNSSCLLLSLYLSALWSCRFFRYFGLGDPSSIRNTYILTLIHILYTPISYTVKWMMPVSVFCCCCC